jgi:predicted Zn-dependent protease
LSLGDAMARVDFRDGIEYLQNKVDEKPEDTYGYELLASLYWDLNLFEESIATLN